MSQSNLNIIIKINDKGIKRPNILEEVENAEKAANNNKEIKVFLFKKF